MTITLEPDADIVHEIIDVCRFPSPVGELLACMIDAKLCWLQIGDVEQLEMLEAFLYAQNIRYSEIREIAAPVAFSYQVDRYFAGELERFDYPLRLLGTDFQKQVWNIVRDIPFGSTTSYKDIAETVGNVKAVRAVAAAIGSNPVPIFVPCHRVVGSNGNLTGYIYGIEVKKALLVNEGALLA
jgi:O-6-methylguanine DNA methyltransferase